MYRKQIPGFSNYFASCDGDISDNKNRQICPYPHNGYERTTLINDKGNKVGVYIQRLVVLAWIGPIKPGMKIHHIDGDTTNNTLVNLRVGPPLPNQRIVDSNRMNKHLRNYRKLLKQYAIVALHKGEMSTKDIAEVFGYTTGNISRIIRKHNLRKKELRSRNKMKKTGVFLLL